MNARSAYRRARCASLGEREYTPPSLDAQRGAKCKSQYVLDERKNIMPAGLNKATNYYNKLEALRDWRCTVAEAESLGLGEEARRVAPADHFGWRRIDKCTSKLRGIIRDAQLRFGADDAGQDCPSCYGTGYKRISPTILAKCEHNVSGQS